MICADNAKFILAFVNIGLVPDTGATYLLTKSLGTARTMELAATGRPVSAEEAKELGLAYKVVAKEYPDQRKKYLLCFTVCNLCLGGLLLLACFLMNHLHLL